MATERPNVLLIMADQLTRRVMGSFGGPVPTPGLDRLRARGVDFTRATTPFPVYSPARASLVTGLHVHTHGVAHNEMTQDYPMATGPGHDRGVTRDDQTTEGLLHAHGYRTYHRGKWHLSDGLLDCYSEMYRETQEYGVEMAAEFAAASRAPEYMRWYGWTVPVEVAPVVRERYGPLLADPSRAPWGGRYAEYIGRMGRLRWPEESTFDHKLTSRAIGCIEEAAASGAPFMVTCSLNSPHDPNVVPDPYYSQFDPERLELPPTYHQCGERHLDSLSRHHVEMLGEAGVREFLRIYYGAVALVDRQVQRLLDALERCGVAERTLVIFTADHGDMAGGHGMVWKSTEAFYDELVRVPLLVAWPGQREPGVDERAVSLVDLMPTILEVAGVAPERPVQGRSLLAAGDPDDFAFTVSQRLRHDASNRRVTAADPLSAMIRTADRKLARYADGAEELFDLAADPDELANLAADPAMAGERRRLLRLLADWMRETAHPHQAQYEALARGS